jgi:hypothetical protein
MPARVRARVLPWQLTSRLARAAALGCFLAAFGLPATPAGRPARHGRPGRRAARAARAGSAAASVGMLAASFAPVTGTHVSPSALAAFFVGTSTVLTVVGLALARSSARPGPARHPPAEPAPATTA